MIPTTSQAAALDAFRIWLATDSNIPFVIAGGAGSGKTYTLMNLIIPELISSGRMSFELTSTTHQANQMLLANLLAESVSSEPPSTLHSMLGLQPTNQKQPRNPKGFRHCGYKMRSKIPSRARFILVIDEAYRIDKNLYEILMFLYPNVRLVLIGDPFQVPPVGEQFSHIETIEQQKVLLLESPRFVDGGTLGGVVTSLRKAVMDKSMDYWDIIPEQNDEFIERTKASNIRKYLNNLIDKESVISDTDVVLLTGTKKAEYAYNNYVLNRRNNADLPLVNVGEAFTIETVIESSYEEQSDTVAYLRRLRRFDTLLLSKEWEDSKYGVFTKLDPRTVVILVTPWATRSANTDFMALVRNARDKGHDIVFLRLNIARTINLAQGLTSKCAIIDRNSISAWANHNMRRRLLYTGTSRAALKMRHF